MDAETKQQLAEINAKLEEICSYLGIGKVRPREISEIRTWATQKVAALGSKAARSRKVPH